ncbi:MAG: Prefoldin subunit alpha [Nitrosopumilales archaeon]|nr:MAG: Prefoldin subunit alpha [Nitrosopumilales archaeon]
MSEEKVQQLMYQMQMLESYFAELSQRENSLLNVFNEATYAIESIKGIGEKSESDTLIPIGMGTFIKTKISSGEKIVLNVGAGVAIEKDKDSAINFLESRIKEIQVALQDTTANKQDVASKLQQGKAEMNRFIELSSKTKK